MGWGRPKQSVHRSASSASAHSRRGYQHHAEASASRRHPGNKSEASAVGSFLARRGTRAGASIARRTEGYEPTREAAMAAFARSWRKGLGHDLGKATRAPTESASNDTP